MALQGTFTKYNMIQSGTVTYEVTYPDDLPESHPSYDQRGQTVIEEEPNMIKQGTTYEDKYLVVYNATLCSAFGVDKDENNDPISGSDHKYYFTNVMYRVYDSHESRSLWPDEGFDEYELDQQTNNSGSIDLIDFAYSRIVEQEGMEDLVRV